MIVQPASLGPSGKPRRVLRVVGLVIPVVLLAGVVLAGVLGPSPTPAPRSTAPVVAVASPQASLVDPGRLEEAEPGVASFPSTVAGLDVHGVQYTLEARNRGIARGLVAVAGYLGVDAIPDACQDVRLGAYGPFCERIAVLGEDPWSGATHNKPDAPGFHLHPQFPVGVRIPSQATNVALSPSSATPPVVILGRFNDSRARPSEPGGRHGGLELVVEQVAWVDGTTYPTTPTLDPIVEGPDDSIAELRRGATMAEAFLSAGAYPLLAALVDPTSIAAIEPRAAPAAARLTGPAWLLRSLHERDDTSRIDWHIVAEDGRTLIAKGSVDTAPIMDLAGDAGG